MTIYEKGHNISYVMLCCYKFFSFHLTKVIIFVLSLITPNRYKSHFN